MTTSSLSSIFKVLTVALCIFTIYSITPAQAQAIPAGVELNGYAWSSNIGWISLNCRTGGTGKGDVCGTSNYKVQVNPANRTLNGYAWSSNIGWIRFNAVGNSNFPTGPGTSAVTARLASNSYQNTTLQGWIRACSGTASLSPWCGSIENNTNSGGWDGWISLDGNGYGVNTANFGTPQYVWGGDVVGWVDMGTHVSWYSPTTLTGNGCTITTAGVGTCNGSLTWSFSPDVTNPTIVRISPTSPTLRLTGQSDTNEPVSLLLGDNTFAARSGANGTNITTHRVSAVCGTGLVITNGLCQLIPSGSVTIISLTANPSIVRRGGSAQITWHLSTAPIAGQCTLSGPGFTNIDIANRTNYTTPALTATSKITLDCGASKSEVVITVVPAFNEV